MPIREENGAYEHFFTLKDLCSNLWKIFRTRETRPVELYLSSNSPGADKETNWLPAPAGNFLQLLSHLL